MHQTNAVGCIIVCSKSIDFFAVHIISATNSFKTNSIISKSLMMFKSRKTQKIIEILLFEVLQ